MYYLAIILIRDYILLERYRWWFLGDALARGCAVALATLGTVMAHFFLRRG